MLSWPKSKRRMPKHRGSRKRSSQGSCYPQGGPRRKSQMQRDLPFHTLRCLFLRQRQPLSQLPERSSNRPRELKTSLLLQSPLTRKDRKMSNHRGRLLLVVTLLRLRGKRQSRLRTRLRAISPSRMMKRSPIRTNKKKKIGT